MNIRILIIAIVVALVGALSWQTYRLKKKDVELGNAINNQEYYESLVGVGTNQNGTLRLTIDALNNSKDSLLLIAKSALKEAKVKDKNLLSVTVIQTVVNDSISVPIEPKITEFKETLHLNDLTSVIVTKSDSTLSVHLTLRNDLVLFIEQKKEYRRKYKNGFLRLLHLDWKRDLRSSYLIVNSNKLIQVTNTRIVTIID